MTEVPDHLLRRSRERRAALGLATDGDAGEAPPATADAPASPAPAAATPAPAAPAAAPAAPEPPPPPPPPPPHVEAALRRPKVPRWALPVLAGLPVWALIYAGTIAPSQGEDLDPELALGQEIYSGSCAGCHGGNGEGGTGRPLDEVLLTFPDRESHIEWVVSGSPAPGTPYGDPNRPGGQHISQQGWPAMPGFGGTLSDEEIAAVVRYEREVLGGEEASAGGAESATNEAETGGGDVDQSSGQTEGDDAQDGSEGADAPAGGGGASGGPESSG